MPCSRRPFCSAITCTLRRTSGRTSAASVPSAAATSTVSNDGGQADDHLADARIGAAAEFVHFAQKCNLVFVRQRLDRIDRPRTATAASRAASAWPPPSLPALRDRARRLRRGQQFRQDDLVRVGEAGLLAAHRAHADALLDRMVAVLDDAVLEHPRLAARMLEVQVGRVDRRPHEAREDAIEVAAGEATGQ